MLALGFKEKEFFFTSSANRQIVPISKFSESDLLGLMPIDYWEAVFPGAGAQRVDWVTAKSTLMSEARAKGIFQSRNVRGAGVWNDEGRVVVNMGDHLIVDGYRVELGSLPSRFFYTLGVALPGLRSDPLSADECNLLLNVCSTFKWIKPDFSFLMAGALVTSRVCGALPIRPHVWLTGASQNGKSTLLEGLIAPMIGEPVVHAIGGTSEAGVRQSLKADAIPVLFDEFETTGPKSAQDIAACVELMRASWSETAAMIIKGGSSGNATAFQVRFSAIVSSIRTNLQNDADRSRFAILELAPHGSDQEHWKKLSGLLAHIDIEYGNRLFARTVKMVPILLKNYKKLKIALAKRASQRFGDQYGMLLAGYSILMQDEPFTDADADMLASHVSLNDERDEAKVKDHDDALTMLKTKSVMMMDLSGDRREWSIYEAILESRRDTDLRKDLLTLGIRVELDKVIVAGHTHSEMEKKVFANTRWSKTWINSLLRIPGTVKKVHRIGGYSGLSIEIPISKITD